MERREPGRRAGLSPAPCPQARLHRAGVPGAGAAPPAGVTSAFQVPYLAAACPGAPMGPRNLAGGSPGTHKGGGCGQDPCQELQGTGAITAERICPARRNYRCTGSWGPVSAAAIGSMGIIPRDRGPGCLSGCCSCSRGPPCFPSPQTAPHPQLRGCAGLSARGNEAEPTLGFDPSTQGRARLTRLQCPWGALPTLVLSPGRTRTGYTLGHSAALQPDPLPCPTPSPIHLCG